MGNNPTFTQAVVSPLKIIDRHELVVNLHNTCRRNIDTLDRTLMVPNIRAVDSYTLGHHKEDTSIKRDLCGQANGHRTSVVAKTIDYPSISSLLQVVDVVNILTQDLGENVPKP